MRALCGPGVTQDCLEAEAFKGGEYVLREGDPLGTDAKFYVVEAGTVRCLKSYEARRRRCRFRPVTRQERQCLSVD